MRPDMVTRLKSGEILTIHASRHVLVEAPPSVLPPHLDQLFMNIIAAGFTPILAHVERYRWTERAMPWVRRMSSSGVLMQVTAGSFFGDYGRSARDLSLRFLAAGLVDIVASDAHNLTRRPPGLSKAWSLVRSERGEAEARLIFKERPEFILLGETAAPRKVGANSH